LAITLAAAVAQGGNHQRYQFPMSSLLVLAAALLLSFLL
jgi:hypothetical protein